MSFSICCAPAAPGAISRATAFRHTRRSTTSFASSSVRASGRQPGLSAYGVARADGTRGQPFGCGSRQPIGQIGRKGGGNDGQVGYDAGKRIKGRKIHALVDSEGLPMRVVVHSAEIQDRDGAGLVLDKIRRRFPWLELIWADGGYNAWQVDAAVAKVPRLRLEIVKRSDDIKGFVVLPRRWVVERPFSWFGRNRHLAKDFENLAETLATFETLASIQLTLRRLARAKVVNSTNRRPTARDSERRQIGL
jgi:transposase